MNPAIMPCLLAISAGANTAALIAARHHVWPKTARAWIKLCTERGYIVLWSDGLHITTDGAKVIESGGWIVSERKP